MIMAKTRVALAQINTTVGDLPGNREKILDAVSRAKKAGADLVLFPELALSGYPPEDLLQRPHFLKDCRKNLDLLVDESHGIIIVAGFPEETLTGACNSAAVINNGKLINIVRKTQLPNYGVFDEKRYFQPGTGNPVFILRDHRVAITICEDIWVDKTVKQAITMQDATLVLNLSASPFHVGKINERLDLLRNLAKKTGAHVCYCNMVGGQDELVFDGGSLALGPDGSVICAAAQFTEDLLIADLDAPLKPVDLKENETAVLLKHPSAPAGQPPAIRELRHLDPAEEILEALILGTGDYVRKNGFSSVILGLSGGIDSSVVACVAVEALGKDRVYGITMPSRWTSGETRSDAQAMAEKLGIDFKTIPIGDILDAYMHELKDPFGTDEPGLAKENLQARIRGNILMAMSNRFGYMVLTTGNKSETATGYCTLYGDMAGGFAVIKDVPKTMVYRIASIQNKRLKGPIPQSVIERPPTAELAPGQKDSDSLPEYDILDRVLHAYIEEGMTPMDMTGKIADEQTIERIINLVYRSEYKRRQGPPGVKITPKAFGRDRRLPIANHYTAAG